MFYYWTNEMHRTPAEFKELSRRDLGALWACMDIALDEAKKQEKKAKSASRRKR